MGPGRIDPAASRPRIARLSRILRSAAALAFWAAAAHGAPAPEAGAAPAGGVPALPDSVAVRSAGWRSARFAGDGTVGPFPLGVPHLFAGSETVARNGTLLAPGADYTLDPNRGSLILSVPASPSDTLVVRFRALPFAVPPSFSRWIQRPVGTPAESVAAEPPADYGKSLLDAGGLRAGGSKSVAVVVGSDRDLTIEQALRVSLEGSIARDVSVVARLSDENLPFTPEGSSARLDELQKVFVEIEAPHLGATLGDYEVDLRGGEFATYRRVLKGAMARLETEPASASASAGVSPGRQVSVELRGVEGLQGPYALITQGRETIVAGSEEIYLDGARLDRGEDNDYVIDYSRGEVRFSSRRPIRTGARIAADFQLGGEAFKRNFVTASGRGRTDPKGALRAEGGVTFLSEADDADEPQEILLTEADRETLAAAGDATPLVSGATYVGEGGDYDSLDGRFVWAGEDSGAFDVVFTFLGGGLGRYDVDVDQSTGRLFFVFDLADSSGDYEPVRALPRPTSRNVVVLDAAAGQRGGSRLEAEAAFSRFDRNVLSEKDDGDNGGAALRLLGTWEGRGLAAGGRNLGDARASVRARRLGEGFASLSRVDEVHFDRRWNGPGFDRALSPDSIPGNVLSLGEGEVRDSREDLIEGNLAYTPRKGVVASLDAGSLNREGGLRSDRGMAGLELSGARLGRAGASAERIESEEGAERGSTERLRGHAGSTIGRVSPGAVVTRESIESGVPDSSVATRRDRGEVSMSVTPSSSLVLGVAAALEDADIDSALAPGARRWFRADEEELSASLTGGAPFTVASRYRRRRIDYASFVTTPDGTSHLGRIEVRHGSRESGLSGEWDYDVTTEETALRRRVFVRVPEDRPGDFDSLGNFVPGRGDFFAADIEEGRVPTTDLAASTRLTIEPGRWMRREAEVGEAEKPAGAPAPTGDRWWRILEGWRFETLARVTERSTIEDKASLLLFDPEAFQREDATVRGETLVRIEGNWRPAGGGASLLGRWARTDVEDNSVVSAHRDELRREGLIRLRGDAGADLLGQVEWERRRSVQKLNGAASADLATDAGTAELSYQPDPRLSLTVSSRLGRERERLLEEELDTLEPAAAVTATVLGRARLAARLATLRFLSDERVAGSGSSLASFDEGEEWRLTADYDLSRVVGASILYSADNRRQDGPRHFVRMEARAFF